MLPVFFPVVASKPISVMRSMIALSMCGAAWRCPSTPPGTEFEYNVVAMKSTGARARPDPPGCFVMSTGQYKGNCNYNLNKSATCHPPCTLYGSEVRQLCVRK